MNCTFNKPSLLAEIADLMINAAESKAKEQSLSISISIVDESGILKAFRRMDGAPLVSVGIAHKKAITAVGFGFDTGDAWFNFIKDDPILREGVASIDNFILLGGGRAIVIDNRIVGAIGISGGHYKQDQLCADAAIDIINEGK